MGYPGILGAFMVVTGKVRTGLRNETAKTKKRIARCARSYWEVILTAKEGVVFKCVLHAAVKIQ